MMVLLLGFFLVAVMVSALVMGVTAVYVGERKLQSLADAAATDAADSFVSLHRSGAGEAPVVELDPSAVSAAAASYLTLVGAEQSVPGLALGAPTGTPDGRTAEVTLTAVVRPPLVGSFVPAGIDVTATGRARVQIVP